MGIKFSCSSCASVLNVKDEYAGKSAKCPKCETVLKIPVGGDLTPESPVSGTHFSTPVPLPESPSLEAPSFQTDSSNPYSAPNTQATGSAGPVGTSGSGRPTAIDAGRVLSHAMNVWQNNLGILVGVTAIFMGILFAISFGYQIVMQIAVTVIDEPLVIIPILFLANVVQTLIPWYLTVGMTKVALSVARGRPTNVGTLFDGEYYLPYVGASLIAFLTLVPATLLLVIPAIILALYFWPFATFIADGKAGAFDSFGKAAEIAKLNMGTTLVLALASIGIMLAGFLAVCVGILFAAPLVSVVWTSAYLMMRGEIC